MADPTEEQLRRVRIVPGMATSEALAALQADMDAHELALAAHVSALATAQADLTTLLARATEARLAELDPANMPYVLDQTYIEAVEIERHLHNRERWFGISADQSGNEWALEDGLVAYRAISGNGDFGSDADDEAKVFGTDDLPAIAGTVKHDSHRLMIEAASNATTFVIRVIWGSGTMQAAITAGSYTTAMVTEARKGSPIELLSLQAVSGTDKLWVQVKNATNNATLDFFYGIHQYED
jgi:hypothetical protein